MIFIIFFRYIFGFVRFKIISDFPEMAVNVIKNANLNIWNIKRKGCDIEAEMFAKDYKKLKHILHAKKTITKIIKRKGIIFKMLKYKLRFGHLVGGMFFIIALVLLPNYIWNVNVIGNKSIEKQEIINALSELGVKEGAPIKSIDARSIPSSLKLKLSDVAWAAVNIEGAVANVEITERVIADVETTNPSNLIAGVDGVVVRIEVLGGTLKVKLGDTVRRGDLLVSGISQYKNGKEHFERAYGKVICRTKEEITVKIPFEQSVILKTGKTEIKRLIKTPFFDIPLFFMPIDFTYEKSVTEKAVTLNNNYIPIKLVTAKFYETKQESLMIDEETANSLAQKRLQEREKEMVGDGRIVAKQLKYIKTDDAFYIKAEYICEKNVALEEKILIGTVN